MVDYDLLRAARAVKSLLPINVIPHRVKGHLDDSQSFDALSFVEKQNVLMDALAKPFRSHVERRHTSTPLQSLPGDEWTLSIGHKRILTDFRSTVLFHRHSELRKRQLIKVR